MQDRSTTDSSVIISLADLTRVEEERVQREELERVRAREQRERREREAQARLRADEEADEVADDFEALDLEDDAETAAAEDGAAEDGLSEDGADTALPGLAEPARRGPTRLVVLGDSNFASDQLLQASQANVVLLIDTLNWLAERESLLGIPPKKPERVRLSLTGGQMAWLYGLALLILPGLSVILGVVVWLRRRR